MEKQFVGGFISLKSIVESNSREVSHIYLDQERYDTVMKSGFHEPEKRQYEWILSTGIPTTYVSKEKMGELIGGTTSGGIAAEVGERRFSTLEDVLKIQNGYFSILDGIEDPFNFAYALRSMYAAGVDAVILPERNFFTATEVVVRSSAGASELIRCCTVPDIAEACKEMKTKGIRLVSTAKTDKAKDLYRMSFRRPLCVIYGGERRGISSAVMEQCDCVVKIKYPRNCHYSLPACSAISIISFEIGKRI